MRFACSLPSPEPQEVALAVEAWCELLTDRVPVDRLNDCYLYAMKHRSSTFPLAVTEMLDAWRSMAAEAEVKRRPGCVLCGGHGSALVYSPKEDREYWKDCPYCSVKKSELVSVNQVA